MKRIILIGVLFSLINLANASIIIRNKNIDDGYSMKVTYRICDLNENLVFCNAPSSITIPKGQDYVEGHAHFIIIDSAALTNDVTQEIKAQSTYVQYPQQGSSSTYTQCNTLDKEGNNTFPESSILSLNNMTSPYVICHPTYNFNFHRAKP